MPQSWSSVASTRGFGNRIGSQHVMGMAITKIAINHTGAPSTGYRVELRTAPDTPSTYGDGLSFAQGWAKKPPLSFSNFTNIQETDEPYDAIDFDQGRVEVDKAVELRFLHHRHDPEAGDLPAPGTGAQRRLHLAAKRHGEVLRRGFGSRELRLPSWTLARWIPFAMGSVWG